MRHLWIKLVEYMQNLYAKNYKSPEKNPKKDLNSGYIVFMDWKTQIVKMRISPNVHAIPVKNPLKICRYRLACSNIYIEKHNPRMTKIILKKREDSFYSVLR